MAEGKQSEGNRGDYSQDTQETHEFMLEECKYLTSTFQANEEMGERRANLFFTIATGILTLLFAAKQAESEWIKITSIEVMLISFFLAAIGILTIVKVSHRNRTTDDLKEKLGKMRQYFIEHGSREYAHLPFPFKQSEINDDLATRGENISSESLQGEKEKRFSGKIMLGKGGIVQLVALVNSFIIALASYIAFFMMPWKNWWESMLPVLDRNAPVLGSALLACFVLIAAWFGHLMFAKTICLRTDVKAQ